MRRVSLVILVVLTTLFLMDRALGETGSKNVESDKKKQKDELEKDKSNETDQEATSNKGTGNDKEIGFDPGDTDDCVSGVGVSRRE